MKNANCSQFHLRITHHRMQEPTPMNHFSVKLFFFVSIICNIHQHTDIDKSAKKKNGKFIEWFSRVARPCFATSTVCWAKTAMKLCRIKATNYVHLHDVSIVIVVLRKFSEWTCNSRCVATRGNKLSVGHVNIASPGNFTCPNMRPNLSIPSN